MLASKLREMSDEELSKLNNELRKDLVMLRIQTVTGQAENPVRARFIRKDVARIMTILQERHLQRKAAKV